MICSSAGNNHNALSFLPLFIKAKLIEFYVNRNSAFKNKTRSHCVCKNFWLLVDFFKHKMLISAFFRGRNIPVNMERLLYYAVSVFIKKINVVFVKHSNFFLVKEVDIAGVLKNSRNIACNKVFTFAKTYNERAFLSCGNDSVRKVLAQNSKSIAAFQAVYSRLYSFKNIKRIFIVIVYKMSNDFCVCVALKNNAFALKPRLELCKVLDNSVVNNSDCSAFVKMRMGVYVARLAVGRPSCMPDSKRTFDSFLRDFFFKSFERAFYLAHQNILAVKHCDSRAVISAVLKFFKRIHQNRCSIFIADISYNSTHGIIL